MHEKPLVKSKSFWSVVLLWLAAQDWAGVIDWMSVFLKGQLGAEWHTSVDASLQLLIAVLGLFGIWGVKNRTSRIKGLFK